MITVRFAGSLKPLCQSCFRRVFGIERNGGWWCTNCEEWVVKPKEMSAPVEEGVCLSTQRL